MVRRVVNLAVLLELQKLGNVPDLLRKAADRYEQAVLAGQARRILDGGQIVIALNDGDDVTTAKSRITLVGQDIEAPDL